VNTYILMVYLVRVVRCILHVYVNGNHNNELTALHISGSYDRTSLM